MTTALAIDRDGIGDFCGRWRVTEFSLFGSVLRDSFRPDSDVDVLLTFEPGAPWTLWDLSRMRIELEGIFGRDVDLVERRPSAIPTGAGRSSPISKFSMLPDRDKVHLWDMLNAAQGVVSSLEPESVDENRRHDRGSL